MGKIIEWFLVTIIMGFIPVGVKLFICLLDGNGFFQNITALDFIIWGFIVNLSIINEREGRFLPLFNASKGTAYLSKISVLYIVLYAIVYTYGLSNENGMQNRILYDTSVVFSIATLVLCIAYIFLYYCFVARKAPMSIEIEGDEQIC